VSTEEQFELAEELVRGTRCRVFRRAPRTLPALLNAVPWDSEATCLVYGPVRYTYRQVSAEVDRLAQALRAAHGVGPGSRVGLAMRNLPEWAFAFLALARLGAIPVVMNSRASGDELVASRDSIGTTLLLVDSRCGRELAPHPGACPTVVFEDATLEGVEREREQAGITAAVAAGAQRRHDLLARSATAVGAGGALPEPAVAPLDPATILFTSGTTGRAKGAVLSHWGTSNSVWTNLYAGHRIAADMAARYGITLQQLAAMAPQTCMLLMFPFFHTSGLHTGLLATLVRGGKIVLMRRWDAAAALQLIESEKVTQFPCVPTMMWDLLQQPDIGDRDLKSLSSVSTGGQALQSGLLEAMTRAFPRAVPGTGFGMTETTGAVAMSVGEEYLSHPGTAGRVLATTDIKIVREDGSAAAVGEPGEVCLRSVSNMLGYWGDAEETARAFDAEGYMRSGDVGCVDADGFLYIVDRKKDMVISAGENIYCAEVERVLLAHPALAEGTAYGVPDGRLGERLVAIVVPHASAGEVTPEAVQRHVAAHLAAYKVPTEVIVRRTPLPRNHLDKVDKVALRRGHGAR
jgi:long-chain acyl-CoA synthetase